MASTTVTNGSGDKAGLLTSATGVEEESNVVGTSFSLVRYNNPVLIDKHSETPSITPSTSSEYFLTFLYFCLFVCLFVLVPSHRNGAAC